VGVESPDEYCRQIEAYLCRKNDGHLIRIVGPAFEQVTGWAARGVPLKVACTGIDRYFERYYKKGPRRRPVRVEFCEADVLDAFDEWRRAVGISGQTVPRQPGDGESAESSDETARRHGSLTAHVDRAIARLTALRAGADRTLDDVLDAIVRELDAARAGVGRLRGDARLALVARLGHLDAELLAAARSRCDPSTLAALDAEADTELAPFRSRMPGELFDQSHRAAVDRLIRERHRLPTLTFD
jgi:hypothetical protein